MWHQIGQGSPPGEGKLRIKKPRGRQRGNHLALFFPQHDTNWENKKVSIHCTFTSCFISSQCSFWLVVGRQEGHSPHKSSPKCSPVEVTGGPGVTQSKFWNRRNARLTAIFHDNLGRPVPECLHSGFCWS